MPLSPIFNDCPFQINEFYNDFNYELTQTFNPMLYNRVSAHNIIPEFISNLTRYLDNLGTVETFTVVLEYTKARMPHLHCCINSTQPIDTTFRNNVIKAFQRMYGRLTFKDVLDIDSYNLYLQKELETNYKVAFQIHYYQFMNY